MYGWRARVGMVMAHQNTTMEPEFNKLAPAGVSVHASRMFLRGVSVQAMTTENESLAAAARLLDDLNIRVVANSCNGSSIVKGLEGETEQTRIMTEACGRPAVLATTAVLEALAALEIKKVAFATLYPPDLNERNTAFWKACGVEAVTSGGVAVPHGKAEPYSATPISGIGLQPPEFAYNLARSVYAPGADAVVVIGGNVRTIEIAEQFERDFGIPFISTNLALFWASMQVAGIHEPILGYGRLLRTQPPLQWARLPRP